MILYHRLLSTTYLKAPKAVKGEKPKAPKRDINGSASLYYRKMNGLENPSEYLFEKVRRGMRLICYDTD